MIIFHAIWHYNKSRKTWKKSVIWPKLRGLKVRSIGDLFYWIVNNENSQVLELFILICWSLWMQRNQFIFQQVNQTPDDILARATRTLTIYRDNPHNPIPIISHQPGSVWWHPPPLGTLKVNVDAAVFESNTRFGIGIVRRDNNGHILFAECRLLEGRFSPFLAETIVIHEGMLKAKNYNWPRWIIESDALKAIIAIENRYSLPEEGNILDSINSMCASFSDVSFKHCDRNANKVTHELARISMRSGSNVKFESAIPLCIKQFVVFDLVMC